VVVEDIHIFQVELKLVVQVVVAVILNVVYFQEVQEILLQ
jgi:hypothetical protein